MSSSNFVFADLTRDKLNVEDIISLVTSEDCGAISVFLGITRNNFQNQEVVRLEYEAYEPMARKQLVELCHEVAGRWQSIKKVAIVHRLGWVPVTEASIVIAVSSPHRKEAMEASNFAIDQLKARVAIWKKEIYRSGEPQWKENSECSWTSSPKVVK